MSTGEWALSSGIMPLVRELRPKQWTKNLLVFAGLTFSHSLFDAVAFLRVVAAFIIFCAISSSAYIVNDLVDLEKDRAHPIKCNRPLASGALSPTAAKLMLAVILLAAFPSAFLLSPRFFLVTASYFLIVMAYSFYLKHQVLLDVFAISAGFVLRAVAGAEVISVTISSWLLVCTVLLSLFLAIAKRRHELVLLEDGAAGHRQILGEYSRLFLDQLIAIVTSATIIAYSLYTFSPNSSAPNDRSMMLTIPFVLYALFRYLYLIYQRNEGGSPETLLLKDRPLLISIALWGLLAMAVLYTSVGG